MSPYAFDYNYMYVLRIRQDKFLFN